MMVLIRGRDRKTVFDAVTKLIKNKYYYREASSECVKMAMAYPEEEEEEEEERSFLDKYVFDYYSESILLLHLPPSTSTHRQVKDRFYELRKEVMNIGFHGATLAHSVLSKAASSCKESYLDWKPPVVLYHVDVIEDHMKSAHHLHDENDNEKEEEEVSVGVEGSKKMEEDGSKMEVVDDNDEGTKMEEKEKDKEESEDDEDASLSPKLRILKKKVFDEMPQNPHYTPLNKYNGKVREGMILGLEVAFTKLCEEIRDLVDIDSFWDGLDGFYVQLSQFKEMGYNVEKVREKIDILNVIGDSERASRAEINKFEYEISDCEIVVNILRSRIPGLGAKIAKIEEMILDRKFKIETLKKDSCNTMAKFTAAAKSNWG